MKKTMSKNTPPTGTQENIKICELCGEMILGECEYVRTKRGTELYFHKGMSCRKEKP